MHTGTILWRTEHLPDAAALIEGQHEMPTASRAKRFLRVHIWFLVAAIFCLSFAAWNLPRGWVAHDDGALAQSAERVLHGELPHRDFDEIYGGLLDYFHAASFAIFGVRLLSMRFVLFFFFICWLPCFYAIALRFVQPFAAAGATVLAACWTIPLYSASMPSWYNLFFATFACLALLQFLTTGKRKWLIAAGIFCAVSILIKITGIYAMAAVLLALVNHEQERASSNQASEWRNPGIYRTFVILSVGIFAAAVFKIFVFQGSARYVFTFFLPCFVVSVYLMALATRVVSGHDRARFRYLFDSFLSFGLGVAIPIGFFLFVYTVRHALPDLVNGLFVAPLRRLTVTIYPPGGPFGAWAPLLLLGVAVAGAYLRATFWITFAFLVAVVFVFVYTGHHPLVYRMVWLSIANLPPFVAAIAVVGLIRSRAKIPTNLSSQIFAVVAFAVCCNLIRYPYASPIYLAYVLPLILLAIIAASCTTPRRSPGVLAILMLFFAAFAIFRARPGHLVHMSSEYVADEQRTPLGVERGKEVLVKREAAKVYQEAMETIRLHSHSDVIYAGPEAPEIYFLSHKKNPTRVMFDFLDPSAESQALEALRGQPIDVVVIRNDPQFSRPVSAAFRSYVTSHFPYSKKVGGFEIYWIS